MLLKDKSGEKVSVPKSKSPPPAAAVVPVVVAAGSQISQIIDLFPEADVSMVQAALRERGNKAESVIAAVLDGTLSLKKKEESTAEDGVAAGKPPRKKLTKSSNVVYFVGKKPVDSQDDSAAESGTKTAILTRLERMEEEDERERIRTFEKMRRSGAFSESEYADEPDDSFDEFLRFDFQDGEALGEGDKSITPTPAAAVAGGSTKQPTDAPVAPNPEENGEGDEEEEAEEQPPPGQQQQQQQPGGRGRGVGRGRGIARTKAPHEYKKHHQKDRALRKRGGMFPK